MRNKYLVIMTLILGLFTYAGCASTSSSELTTNWGTSVAKAKSNQILNHEASKNLDPVVGVDGKSAEKILQRYEKSFEKVAPEYSLDTGAEGVVVK
jgi:hypothetical protein